MINMGRTRKLLALATCLIPPATVSAKPAQDDLILQTRLDQKSVSWIIDKTRLILTNSNLSDGMTDTASLSEDTLIPLDDFSSNPVFIKLKDTIARIFKVDAKGAFLKIRIPKIYYKVHTLHARPNEVDVKDPAIRVKATAKLQGVDIGLPDGIQLDFMIPNPKTRSADAYLTAYLKAVSVEVPKTLEPAEFEVDLEAYRDQEFRFKLMGSRLDSLPEYVTRHMDDLKITGSASGLPLSPEDLAINPVVVRLNSLSRSISFDEFKPIVQKHMPNIISSVIKQVGQELKKTIGPSILKTVFSKTIPSTLSISDEAIYTRYLTSSFTQPAPDQLALFVSGELCTDELYRRHQEGCVNHVQENRPVRSLSIEDLARAREEVQSKIASGGADVALSVSEPYLNRLLQTTIDAKLWEEMLKEENLELGPRGAFVVLNKAGEAPEIYLDVVYKGGPGLQRIVINPRHPIRFPLRMSTKMTFDIRKEMPVLSISIDKLKSDATEIINGIPEYDLPSDLVRGLRKKIASMIIKMATEIEGKNAIEMELPVFKGLGLERTWQETSAHGRLNLYFKL